ncbi:MAG: T9SS type A sorting domain-containing protein [bacterium]|nr:T9SS type A sorting domain-containing protein [bacterium]
MKYFYRTFAQCFLVTLLICFSTSGQNSITIAKDQSISINSSDQSITSNIELAVNELHMVPDSGRSGYPISISYTINNTDQFVSFQFDIILPSVLTFVEDSVWLFRKTNHIIIANLINQQTLRIFAYSPTNQPFTGNSGEIVRVLFNLSGTSGTYNVGLNNVVVSNSIGVNILTGYYPGFIKIIAPDISGQTNIDFGEVSVLDTLSYNYQLSNTGNDTLFITEFSSSEIYFWNETTLPQDILPGESQTFNLKFHNINKGLYNSVFTIRSNDPDEDPFYLNAAALSFAPNYMLIQDAEAFVGDTVTLKIDVNNYEPFVNFQVDLDFPDSLTFVPNSAELTNRKQDHLVFEALLSSNKLRLFTFTQNQLPFIGDSGTVVTINFVVGNDTGIFPLHLTNAILADVGSQNLIRGTFDGEIRVRPVPTFQLSVNLANGWNMVSIPGKHPLNQNINTWWPFRDLTADVFKYSGGYQSVLNMVPGTGYFLKQAGARTYNTGDEWPANGIQVTKHYPIPGVQGWNLFGGYELIVATSEIITVPPGLQTGTIYKYSGGYHPALTIEPGYGYWIKLTNPGYIILPEEVAENILPKEFFPADWGKIIFSDASGINYTLYTASGAFTAADYELPPAPMPGMFDIRFSSGRIAEDINNSMKTIEMSGVTYPLTVRVEGMDIRLMDESGKTLNVNLKDGEDVVISDATIKKLKVTGELLPTIYALEQNYPNPFNPSTTINYSISNDEYVKLVVYNTLGEVVATLVNKEQKAGRYEIVFSAAHLATGVYVYRIETPNYTSSKKLMLMK